MADGRQQAVDALEVVLGAGRIAIWVRTHRLVPLEELDSAGWLRAVFERRAGVSRRAVAEERSQLQAIRASLAGVLNAAGVTPVRSALFERTIFFLSS